MAVQLLISPIEAAENPPPISGAGEGERPASQRKKSNQGINFLFLCPLFSPFSHTGTEKGSHKGSSEAEAGTVRTQAPLPIFGHGRGPRCPRPLPTRVSCWGNGAQVPQPRDTMEELRSPRVNARRHPSGKTGGHPQRRRPSHPKARAFGSNNETRQSRRPLHPKARAFGSSCEAR